MDAIPLDPGDYDGTYKLVGGEISLDFVNTISWPGSAREHDWLDRPENMTAWAEAAGVLGEEDRAALDGRGREVLRAELARVIRIRVDLRDLLAPFAFGERPTAQAVEKLNVHLREICGYREIDPKSRQWIWIKPDSLTAVLAPVIWNAAHVLTESDHTRVGHCPSCDWLFYDTTRNRSRRWCDMNDCGSRDKALRYYHRKVGR